MHDKYDHHRMKSLHDAARRVSTERSKEHSKRQLIDAITKKMKTAMIGSLSSIEEALGFLWGLDLPEEERTQDQLDFEENVWQPLRTEILNKGNNQLRAAIDEITQYDMTWQKYQTELIIKKD